MARIRSIHPGLFTDEAFVSVSMAARVLLPGIWTESDDHGVFEWKPLTLKMKVFPADNVDVDALLVELVGADAVKKFSAGGKEYGAVRNFGKYQRPKKPAYRHPLPDELRTYVATKDAGTEPVEDQFSPSGEISPQMEDEGGSRGVEIPTSVPREEPQPSPAAALANQFFSTINVDPQAPELAGMAGLPHYCAMWLERGYDRSLILATAAAVKSRDGPLKSLSYFAKAIENAHVNGPPKPPAEKTDAADRGGGFKGALARLGERADELERRALLEGGQAPPRLLSHG